MLHYETVESSTLELLKKLLEIDIFKNLRLVGGTSLSLQVGHRISIDIDLFGNITEDILEIDQALAVLGDVKKISDSKHIHIYVINGVKVDIVNYPYPWIGKMITEDNLRLADVNDIAAMKLAAVTGRGTKKDLFDIYFLLNYFTLKQMLELYEAKYKDGSTFMVLKSLSYFDDAEKDEMPLMLKKVKWETVKQTILAAY
jgi:predicted nucleotidyltransferase component of viral defense system